MENILQYADNNNVTIVVAGTDAKTRFMLQLTKKLLQRGIFTGRTVHVCILKTL